jgi:hypothetical protein
MLFILQKYKRLGKYKMPVNDYYWHLIGGLTWNRTRMADL